MPTYGGVPVEDLDAETLQHAYARACTVAYIAAQQHDLTTAETHHVFARHILALLFEREETSEGQTVN